MRGTQKALIARGVDAETARILADGGWTLNNLKLAKNDELEVFGLGGGFLEALFKEARPPIPIDILMNVLFANRYQCCVCRDPKLPYIVHHIEEWAESRLHCIENLAVLCLHHHDEAHSKKTLSRNLDAKTLRDAKVKWEAEVKRFDAESILAAMRVEYSNWNYMNELRVFELAKAVGINLKRIPNFESLVGFGVVQPDGLPTPVRNEGSFYKYEGPDIKRRYFYVSAVLHAVIHKLSIVNISDHLDKGVLRFSLVSGDFIFVQGAHTFSPITQKKNPGGRGQICKGVRKANNVEVRFIFDRWEATSSSARCVWLSGTKNLGSLVHVKDVSRENEQLVITGTVLGICSDFGDLKQRDYAKSLPYSLCYKPYDDDDDDDWNDFDEF